MAKRKTEKEETKRQAEESFRGRDEREAMAKEDGDGLEAKRKAEEEAEEKRKKEKQIWWRCSDPSCTTRGGVIMKNKGGRAQAKARHCRGAWAGP